MLLAHSLTLECKASGSPPPVLTWLKDGAPVKASDNIHVDAGGRRLKILSAVELDRGQYVCMASSVAGEKEVKYEVAVLGKRGCDTWILRFTAKLNGFLELLLFCFVQQ